MTKFRSVIRKTIFTIGLLLAARVIHLLIQFSLEKRLSSLLFLFVLAYALIVPVYLAKNLDDVGKAITGDDSEFWSLVLDISEKILPLGRQSLPLLVVIKLAHEVELLALLLPPNQLKQALVGLNYAAFISIILFAETQSISEDKSKRLKKIRDKFQEFG